VYDKANVSHLQGKYATFNVLFKDGHVAPARDTNFLQGIVSRPTLFGARLDDYVDVIETEADGRNPQKTNADPKTKPASASAPMVNRITNYHPTVPW